MMAAVPFVVGKWHFCCFLNFIWYNIGGGVTFRLIREAVDEYARRNPDSGTVEDFLDALISSGFIPEEILRRCEILASLLDTGDFHLLLEEKEMQLDGMICNQFAIRIAERINNPRNLTEAASYPQVHVYIIAEPSVLIYLLCSLFRFFS